MLSNPRNIQHRNVSDPPFIGVNGQATCHGFYMIWIAGHKNTQRFTLSTQYHVRWLFSSYISGDIEVLSVDLDLNCGNASAVLSPQNRTRHC